MVKSIRKHKEALIIISLYFIILAFHAGKNSYWRDELYSVYLRGSISSSFSEHIDNIKELNPVCPLYETTLFTWMDIFGESEASTRTLSIIFTCLAGLLIYLFALGISNKRIAIASLLFFLLLFSTVSQALNSRYYAQMLFLTSLSSYIMLLFFRYLNKTRVSWKNFYLNRYFPLFVIVNTLLLFNHTFNYLFYTAQGIFFLFFLTLSIENGKWKSISIHVIITYLLPIAFIALVWPPITDYAINLLSGFTKTYFYSSDDSFILFKDGKVVFATLLFITLIIILVIPIFILPARVNLINWRRSDKRRYWNQFKVRLFFFLSIIIILIVTDFFLMREDWLTDPDKRFLIFTKSWLNSIFLISPVVLTGLVFGLTMLIIHQRHFFVSFPGSSGSVKRKKLFHLYLIIIPLFSLLFLPVVFTMRNIGFHPRYLTYCIPLLMIYLALLTEFTIIFVLGLLGRVITFSHKKLFLKNSLYLTLAISILLFGPGMYMQLNRSTEYGWREMAKDIIDVVRKDESKKYFILETSEKKVPIMDFYFKKLDNSIRVGGKVTYVSLRKMTNDSTFILPVFTDSSMEQLQKYDYILVTYTYPDYKIFNQLNIYLNQRFKILKNRVGDYNRGFVIYELQAANKDS